MKIELIEEKDENGVTWYFCKTNDQYVYDSLTKNFEQAVSLYNKLVYNYKGPDRKVIKSIVIEEQPLESVMKIEKIFNK